MGLFDFIKDVGSKIISYGSQLTAERQATAKKIAETPIVATPKTPLQIIGMALEPVVALAAPLIVPLVATKAVITKAVQTIVPAVVKSAVKHPIASIGAVTTIPMAAGILGSSEKAREIVFEKATTAIPEAYDFGKKIGESIEGKDTGVTIKEGLTTAGITGAIVAAGAVIIPKAIEKAKGKVKEAESFLDDQELPVSIPEASVPDTSFPAIPLESEGELNQALLPETVDISPKKRKRRAKKKPVVLNIINKNFIRNSVYVR